MMTSFAKNKWTALIDGWEREVKELFKQNAMQWRILQLPDVNNLYIRAPDENGIDEILKRTSNKIDPELIEFYKVTNGWPLWLGSFWSGIVPISAVDFFQVSDKDGFDLALLNSPAEKKTTDVSLTLSASDVRSAFLVSDAGARELILSIHTHETCMYYFDGVRVFKDFYEYMCYQKNDTYAALKDML